MRRRKARERVGTGTHRNSEERKMETRIKRLYVYRRKEKGKRRNRKRLGRERNNEQKGMA